MSIYSLKRSTQIAIIEESTREEKTASGTTPLTLSNSVSGFFTDFVISGKSEIVSDDVISIGENGLTITTKNSTETLTTSAEISTGLPLRSVSETAFDSLDMTKVIKKCGWIELSSIYWEYLSAQTRFYASLPATAKLPTSGTVKADLLCAPYETVPFSQIQTGSDNNVIAGVFTSGANYISIRDTSYTNAAEFREAMSGVYLVYELVTPEQISLSAAEAAAMKALETYNGSTVIAVTDNPSITVKYRGKKTATLTASKKRVSRKKK